MAIYLQVYMAPKPRIIVKEFLSFNNNNNKSKLFLKPNGCLICFWVGYNSDEF